MLSIARFPCDSKAAGTLVITIGKGYMQTVPEVRELIRSLDIHGCKFTAR